MSRLDAALAWAAARAPHLPPRQPRPGRPPRNAVVTPFKRAIRLLATGADDPDARALVIEAVAALIMTDRAGLDEWLENATFIATDTAQGLAREWDSI